MLRTEFVGVLHRGYEEDRAIGCDSRGGLADAVVHIEWQLPKDKEGWKTRRSAW